MEVIGGRQKVPSVLYAVSGSVWLIDLAASELIPDSRTWLLRPSLDTVFLGEPGIAGRVGQGAAELPMTSPGPHKVPS